MKILLCVFAFLIPFSVGFAHEEESAVLISITEKGFEPSSLSISPHTKVVFINRGTEGHWPASDRHPSHSDYGGTNLETHCSESYDGPAPFDSCRALESGNTWSFIFEEAGTFDYHDHVWSHLGGSIIVREERQKLRIEIWIESLTTWLRSFFIFDIDAFEQKLITLVDNEDPRIAIETLRDKASKKAAVSESCHDLVHEIGRSSLKKYQTLEQALTYQSDFCNSGYIHGVFEQYFTQNSIDPNTLATLCTGSTRLFDAWQCHHGIGHGLMYQNGGDIKATLETCANSLDAVAATECQNGAYMELFNNEILLHELSFIIEENPLASCETMTIEQDDCYLYAPTYYTQNLNWQPEAVLDACLTLENKPRLSCINGTASEAAKRNQYDLTEAFKLCKRFEPSDELTVCVKGASAITVFQTASIDAAFRACKSAGKYIERCHAAVTEFTPLFVETY